jgi:hypothetical protein
MMMESIISPKHCSLTRHWHIYSPLNMRVHQSHWTVLTQFGYETKQQETEF